jgi:IQ calmodulin-binding motif
MGNSLACCGKNDSDPNNINTELGKEQSNSAKMRAIVKIQSLFRAVMARKRVKALRESMGVKSMMHHANFSGPANYDNPAV